jgi:hypothetical protein
VNPADLWVGAVSHNYHHVINGVADAIPGPLTQTVVKSAKAATVFNNNLFAILDFDRFISYRRVRHHI